jgi:hypothetical protein
MTRILVTNGGAHPPEKWAMTTAEQIFDIGTGVAGDRLIQAQKFQLIIAEALMPHYEKAQTAERSKLAEDSNYIFAAPDGAAYADEAVKAIVAASQNTPWQAHFAKADVQEAARIVIADHFHTSQHSERLWFADRHPENEVAQSFKAAYCG